jgi:hypothetical protein
MVYRYRRRVASGLLVLPLNTADLLSIQKMSVMSMEYRRRVAKLVLTHNWWTFHKHSVSMISVECILWVASDLFVLSFHTADALSIKACKLPVYRYSWTAPFTQLMHFPIPLTFCLNDLYGVLDIEWHAIFLFSPFTQLMHLP